MAKSPRELAEATRERLSALARAHALTFSDGFDESAQQATTLQALIRTIVAPFDEPANPRIEISGIDGSISGSAVTSLALLLHEFATNAAKHGALSKDNGSVKVVFVEDQASIIVRWTENNGPPVTAPTGSLGSATFFRGSQPPTSSAAKLFAIGGPKDWRSAFLFPDLGLQLKPARLRGEGPAINGGAGTGAYCQVWF